MPYVTNPTTGAQVWEGTVLPSATQDTVRATLANHESRLDTLEAYDGGSFETIEVTGNGSASTPSVNVTGVPFAGTGTTSFPLVYINETGATASTTMSTAGTLLGVNGNGTSDLVNLMKDGVSKFKVTYQGDVTSAALTTTGITAQSLSIETDESSGINIVTTATGDAGIALVVNTSGTGGTGVSVTASNATGVGVDSTASASGAIAIRAQGSVAGAIPLSITQNGETGTIGVSALSEITFSAGLNITGGVSASGDVNATGFITSTGYISLGTTKIRAGTGSPNGSVIGSPGDLYLNKSGGASTSMYVKESGTATNTGWVGK